MLRARLLIGNCDYAIRGDYVKTNSRFRVAYQKRAAAPVVRYLILLDFVEFGRSAVQFHKVFNVAFFQRENETVLRILQYRGSLVRKRFPVEIG